MLRGVAASSMSFLRKQESSPRSSLRAPRKRWEAIQKARRGKPSGKRQWNPAFAGVTYSLSFLRPVMLRGVAASSMSFLRKQESSIPAVIASTAQAVGSNPESPAGETIRKTSMDSRFRGSDVFFVIPASCHAARSRSIQHVIPAKAGIQPPPPLRAPRKR